MKYELSVPIVSTLLELMKELSFLPDTVNIKDPLMRYCIPYHRDWREGKRRMGIVYIHVLYRERCIHYILHTHTHVQMYMCMCDLFGLQCINSYYMYMYIIKYFVYVIKIIHMLVKITSIYCVTYCCLSDLINYLSLLSSSSLSPLGDTVPVGAPTPNIDTQGHFWLHEPAAPVILTHLALISHTLTLVQ